MPVQDQDWGWNQQQGQWSDALGNSAYGGYTVDALLNGHGVGSEYGADTEGASANYGGSEHAYANERDRLQGLAGGYQGMARGSFANGEQDRVRQQDAMGLMQQAAYGNVPSVAAIQQQQGLNQALRNQTSMAGGARGAAGIAGAQYNAAQNTGAMQQAGINQASQLRAGEMADARGAYGQMTTGMRGQDISQGQTLGQMGLGYEGALGNVNMGELQAQAAAHAQSEAHWRAQMAADEGSNQSFINGTNGLIGGTVGMIAGMKSDVRMKENIQPMQGGYNPFAQPAMPEAYTRPNVSSPMMMSVAAPQGLQPGMGTHEMAPVREYPAEEVRKPSKKEKLYSGGESKEDKLASGLGLLAASMEKMSHQKASFNPDAYQAPNMSSMGISGNMVSDERQKTGLDPQHAEPARMMDNLKPYSYDYKPGMGLPPGRRYGIMAQDLERTPMGASVVENTPRGKSIDASQATGLHFAAEANLNQRLRALESGRGR